MRQVFYKVTFRIFVWLFVFVFLYSLWGVVRANRGIGPDGSETPDGDVLTSEELYREATRIAHEIQKTREELGILKEERRTLTRELAILNTEIEITRLELEQMEVLIGKQKARIREKEQEIAIIEFSLRNKEVVLGELLRSLWRDYDDGIVKILLSENTLSAFFDEIHDMNVLHRDLSGLARDVESIKEKERQELKNLEEERARLLKEKELLFLARFIRDKKIAAREELLSKTDGREAQFKILINESRARLRDIRKDIYEFQNLGLLIPFDELLDEVKRASVRTDVRPALLLAILKVESNFGANVGRGYWRSDMNPRDWDAFLEITSSLGLDPDVTPVSAQPLYGWGGAMGPAQFLPLTWIRYREQVASLTGHNPPSPWSLEDALTAAGLKLSAGGAHTKTDEDEWQSAMMYFAGDNWNDPSFSFYGDAVMNFVEAFEEEFAE